MAAFTFDCTRCAARQQFPDGPDTVNCRACGQPHQRPASTGRVLGRFLIRRVLGKGVFGTVYLARDPHLGRDVALKVPNPATLADPKRVERFLREARTAATLNHPSIVPLFEAGQADGTYYISSAFVEGQSLDRTIAAGTIDPRDAARIVAGLASAVGYAHQKGVIHRDLKPANVLIDANGRPHLLDFGLAARADETEKLTTDGTVLGTLEYLAPEQAQGRRGDPLPASDQYSLGVILYELLTGRTPFEGDASDQLFQILQGDIPPPSRYRKTTPRDLETICLKCLSLDPEDRYRTCAALARDLNRWLAGLPIRARRRSGWERLKSWVNDRLVAAVLAGALLLSVVFVGARVSYLSGRAAQETQRAAEATKRAGDAEAEIEKLSGLVARDEDSLRKQAAQTAEQQARLDAAQARLKKMP